MKQSPSSRRKWQPDQENIYQDHDLDLRKPLHSISHYMNDKEEMINQIFSVVHGAQLQAMLPPILKEMSVEKLKRLCLQQLMPMSQRRILHILEGQDKQEIEAVDQTSATKFGQPEEEEAGDNNKEEESNGKTLMELLELEMRARAIKALLKRQEASDEKGKHPSQDDNQITDTVASGTWQLAGRDANESWPDSKGHLKSMSVKRAMFLQLEQEKRDQTDPIHPSTDRMQRGRREKPKKKDWIFHRKEKKVSDTRHYRRHPSDLLDVKNPRASHHSNPTTDDRQDGRDKLALTTDSQRHSGNIISSDEESHRLEESIGIQEVDIELGSESSSSEDVDHASYRRGKAVDKSEQLCHEIEVVRQETEQIDKGTRNSLTCAKDKEGHLQSQWKETRRNEKATQDPEEAKNPIGSSFQSWSYCKSPWHLDDWHLNSNEILPKPVAVIDNNWSDSSWEDSHEKSPHYRSRDRTTRSTSISKSPDERIVQHFQKENKNKRLINSEEMNK